MSEGLSQGASETVMNTNVTLCTGLPVHDKLGRCSCTRSSHFPDKPKIQIGYIKASQTARLRNSITDTPGLQMMLKVKSVVPLLPLVTFRRFLLSRGPPASAHPQAGLVLAALCWLLAESVVEHQEVLRTAPTLRNSWREAEFVFASSLLVSELYSHTS